MHDDSPTIMIFGPETTLPEEERKKCLAGAAALEQMCFSQPWSLEVLEESFAMTSDVNPNHYYAFFFAVCNGEVAGYLGADVVFEEIGFTNVAVSPKYRRMGIGEKLVEAVLSFAGQVHSTGVTLEVRVSNAPAIGLYRKKNFKEAGIRKGFYSNPKEDALIFWNDLSEEK